MLWTDLLSGKKNAAAMQFYKRYNAMLLKQMYVEYEKGGKTKKQMKKKKKRILQKAMSCHHQGHYFHLASVGPGPPCPF